MRARIILLIAVILASLPLFVRSANAQVGAFCENKRFLDGAAQDVGSVGDLATGIADSLSANGVDGVQKELAQAIVGIVRLRQKYDDMTGLSAACNELRSALVAYLANLSDPFVLGLARLDNPQIEVKYGAFLDGQEARTSKVNQSFQALIDKHKAAISAAAGSLPRTNTPRPTQTTQYIVITATFTPTRLAQVAPTKIPAQNNPLPTPVQVVAPTANNSGPTAKCVDGTYSYAANHQGACSHHKGVLEWYK